MSALSEALMQQKAASSDAFMQENAARPEVTTTESGLQYEVLVEGTGPQACCHRHRGDPLSRHANRRHGV